MDKLEANEVMTRLQDYKDIISSFGELLSIENEALKEFRVNDVKDLYTKKAWFVMTYRNLVAYFIKNNDALKLLDADIKKDLFNKSQELGDLLHENDLLLKTRMETSQTVIDSIVHAAKLTNKSNATSYGYNGGYSPLNNNHNALTFNQTL